MNVPFLLVKIILTFLVDKRRQRFIEACKNPEEAQKTIKKHILSHSTHSFPDAITNYQDYEGQKNLTKESVSFYETTSGSTGARKKIPYTRPFVNSFEEMFLLWVHDVVLNGNLGLRNGKFFMSVSPQIGEESKDDRKYLSSFLNLLLTPFLVSNPNEHQGKTSHDFFLKVTKDLIKARDLEVISVWSPTYLLSLLEFINLNRETLGMPEMELIKLWPELKLISCWTHGQASRSAKALQEKFPNVKIQSKGLMLTEGVVTIPWSEAGGNLPFLTESYLEFVAKDGSLHHLHELQKNSVYRVIMSQKNGFLRYDTKDLVRVTGFYFKTPILEFVGRDEIVCDLAGEKLSEIMLQEIYREINSTILFVPDTSQELPRYILYLDDSLPLHHDWEEKLNSNFHYQLARNLGQLKSLEVQKVKNLNQEYLNFYQSRGMIVGDVKEKMLFSNLDEADQFMKWIAKELPSSQ